jgi:flagellar hook-length control protein FliK
VGAAGAAGDEAAPDLDLDLADEDGSGEQAGADQAGDGAAGAADHDHGSTGTTAQPGGREGAASALAAGAQGTARTAGSEFANQLGAARTTRPNVPTGAAEQVTVQLQRCIKDGNGSISMQLRPEELGRIDIRVDIAKDGAVNATILADRPQTLELLQRDSQTLERALQGAGLQADSGCLNFGLRGEGGQGSGQSDGRNGQHPSGSSRGSRLGVASEDDGVQPLSSIMRRYQVPTGRLDVRI